MHPSSPRTGRLPAGHPALPFVALLLLLAGCGGGGGDPSPAPGAGQPPVGTAPPPAASAPAPGAAFAQQALAAVNSFRAAPRTCGATAYPAAPPLQWNDALARAAAAHASDMAARNYFSHTGADGSSPATRAAAQGYAGSAGENIAAGYATLADAMKGWIASEGHCANLMDARYRDLGVAAASDPVADFGLYWVQVFGIPR